MFIFWAAAPFVEIVKLSEGQTLTGPSVGQIELLAGLTGTCDGRLSSVRSLFLGLGCWELSRERVVSLYTIYGTW